MIADILMRGILKCEQEDFTSRMEIGDFVEGVLEWELTGKLELNCAHESDGEFK